MGRKVETSGGTVETSNANAPGDLLTLNSALEPAWTKPANGGSLTASSAQIDLCATLYSATPGQDITTALQTALNWIASNCPNGGEIYFSKPGTYLLNGASQTGTAQSYSYAGQVLIPAVAEASSMPIRIRGPFPSSGGGKSTGAPNGVILLSNVTSGYVFDIVPSFTQFGCPWTGVMPIFENIVIRSAVDDPSCGGINLLCTQRASLRRVQIDTPNSFIAPDTGSLEALVMPQIYNNGDVSVRDCTIRGYPIGVRLGEHGVFDNLDVAYCKTAFKAGGASHVNWFGYVDVEECPTILAGGTAPAFGTPSVAAGSFIYGFLDTENTYTSGSLKSAAFVNDSTTNRIIGKLTVLESGGGSSPIVGGRGLDLVPLNILPTLGPKQRAGWMETHPYDNFARLLALSGAGAPGQCSPSLHPWRVEAGSFAVSGGSLTGLTGADKCYVPCLKAATWGGISRTITMTTVLGSGTPKIHLYGSAVVNSSETSSASGVAGIEVRLTGGNQVILRADNTNIAAAGSNLVAGNTYTIKLAIYHNSLGYPYAAKVYVNGTLTIASAIPTASASLGGAGPSTWPYYEDGLFFEDTTTAVTLFAVQDLPFDNPQFTTAISYSASMTPDASQGGYQTVAVTNSTAFTVNAPTLPPIATQTQDLTIEFTNSSGGAVTNVSGATWNSAFVLVGGALTDPASTKKRYIRFSWNGSKWIETARASADY